MAGGWYPKPSDDLNLTAKGGEANRKVGGHRKIWSIRMIDIQAQTWLYNYRVDGSEDLAHGLLINFWEEKNEKNNSISFCSGRVRDHAGNG